MDRSGGFTREAPDKWTHHRTTRSSGAVINASGRRNKRPRKKKTFYWPRTDLLIVFLLLFAYQFGVIGEVYCVNEGHGVEFAFRVPRRDVVPRFFKNSKVLLNSLINAAAAQVSLLFMDTPVVLHSAPFLMHYSGCDCVRKSGLMAVLDLRFLASKKKKNQGPRNESLMTDRGDGLMVLLHCPI